MLLPIHFLQAIERNGKGKKKKTEAFLMKKKSVLPKTFYF